MKNKSLVLVVALLVGMSVLALPATSYASHGGWGWGVGAFAGGLLLGTALTAPWYYAPRPVYVYPPAPPVVYAYPAPAPVYAPGQAYAYPDPAYNRAYSQPPAPAPAYNQVPSGGQGQAPGQWVQVPGQWVGDRWVPSHRAWAPVSQ